MKEMWEVELISTDTIKPSSPTPHHLRTFKLGRLDQLSPPIFFRLVLFYSSPTIAIETVQKLKTSLSLKHRPFSTRSLEGSMHKTTGLTATTMALTSLSPKSEASFMIFSTTQIPMWVINSSLGTPQVLDPAEMCSSQS
ncbi:hypothetical protein MRB53_031737 [Persea americana]|uniref:Uncharacterized protein n=1 Tax=Persea americana TaxID=3435 RepID=A0ACC2KQ73_PERAE|nr:hypothetical protein MRB53_031737 [Persea americana]